ncbi:hypothetical protein TthAA22_22240 (plasmid) [Thermus thermophilus]|nr:hypothetical protein TthAA22_22240 [Thermus thermophilus]
MLPSRPPEEDRLLLELSLDPKVHKKTRLWAMMIRLAAEGWTAPRIARHFHKDRATVYLVLSGSGAQLGWFLLSPAQEVRLYEGGTGSRSPLTRLPPAPGKPPTLHTGFPFR